LLKVIGEFLMTDLSGYVKYWTLQHYLNYCHEHCDGRCYSHDGAVYHIEVILKNCPHDNIKKVIKLLAKMDSTKYTLSGELYYEVMKIVEKKFKEKVIKV